MSAKPSSHVCADCGRAYKAAETLNRHRKNHSATTNYVCEICDASFKRKDLLDRHCNIHTGAKLPANHSRSQRACDRCSRLKTRCDNLVPCTRCTRGGHACSYKMKNSRARTDRSSRASLESSASVRSHSSHDSPSRSIETPTMSPEPLCMPDHAQPLDVPEDWMESLWLENPSWQWPQPDLNLAPTQQGMVPIAQAMPMTWCAIPPVPAWQGTTDPSLAGTYLLPPALYSDSDGYSPSTASPSYSTGSLDSPLPTSGPGPQRNPVRLEQVFEQNAIMQNLAAVEARATCRYQTVVLNEAHSQPRYAVAALAASATRRDML